MIDSDTSSAGVFVHCRVIGDVLGADGKVAIPDRTSGVVVVMDSGRVENKSRLILALYQLTVNDKSITLNQGARQPAQVAYYEDAAQGLTHRSVHLQRRSLLDFKLTEAVSLR